MWDSSIDQLLQRSRAWHEDANRLDVLAVEFDALGTEVAHTHAQLRRARSLCTRGQFDAGLPLLETVRDAFEQHGDAVAIDESKGSLAEAYQIAGIDTIAAIDNHDAANALLHTALQKATEFSIPCRRFNIRLELRNLAQQQNDFASYIEHNTAYQELTDHTTGDSYMCFKGDGKAERNAYTAAFAATDMQQSQYMWPISGLPVMFRIGVHIAPVAAGIIGTQGMNRRSNTEYRVQNSMNESENTEFNDSIAESRIQCVERGEKDVKGKGIMTTYWLESV